MATTYQTPGVYVEEVDKGTKPIEVLGASRPAFLGITAQASHKFPQTGAPDPDNTVPGQATLVTNWTQFQTIFGGFVENAFLPDAIYGYFNNGGESCYVTSLRTLHEDHSKDAEKASCNIPSASPPQTGSSTSSPDGDGGDKGSKSKGKKNDGGNQENNGAESPGTTSSSEIAFTVTAKLGGLYGTKINVFIEDYQEEGSDEITFSMIVRYPTAFGITEERRENLVIKDNQLWIKSELDQIEPLSPPKPIAFDGITITAPKEGMSNPARNPRNSRGNPIPYQLILTATPGATVEALSAAEIIGNSARREGLDGLEELDDIRLLVCPDLVPDKPFADLEQAEKERIIGVQKAMDAHCRRLKYRFAILDTPKGLDAQGAKKWREELGIDSSYCALYYPWLEVADLSDSSSRKKLVPPSGIMAGVYNRVDGERGVHKAPANEVPLGVIGLERNLTKGEQDTLNPVGVNCFRRFPGGRGIKIWGGRTLSTEGAWRYINVRRLFITIAASLDAGLQWVVFEPNDRSLWARVRRDINAFLSTFWLNGALFGNSKSEAYYVKCDDELNPPAIRDLGQLIIEVGLCPVKPAEFVILRLSQWAGPNAENE